MIFCLFSVQYGIRESDRKTFRVGFDISQIRLYVILLLKQATEDWNPWKWERREIMSEKRLCWCYCVQWDCRSRAVRCSDANKRNQACRLWSSPVHMSHETTKTEKPTLLFSTIHTFFSQIKWAGPSPHRLHKAKPFPSRTTNRYGYKF